MPELETEVELLKKEIRDQSRLFDRLDIAIEKLTDVSNCINRMLAVHEEKLTRQEEAIFEAEQQIEVRRTELTAKIDELSWEWRQHNMNHRIKRYRRLRMNLLQGLVS